MVSFWMCLTAAALVGLDQLVKALVAAAIPLGQSVPLIPGMIRLTYVRNTGAAFSILSGQRWFFLAVTLAYFVFLILALKKNWFPGRMPKWALTVLTAGAVGNLIDRILTGSVIDMFELEFIRFAVFNVADLCVTAGAVLLCVWAIFADRKKPSGEERDP